MRTRYFILMLSVLLFATEAAGQDYHTRSNKALKHYLQGKEDLDLFYIDQAESNFKLAVKEDKNFYEAWLVLGQLYNDKEQWVDAVDCLSKAVRLDSLFFTNAIFSLGKAEARSGYFSLAKVHLSAYLTMGRKSDQLAEQARQMLEDCEFALSYPNLVFTGKAIDLGDSVNTSADEYWPSIVADGSALYFTREVRRAVAYGPDRQEDFYVSIMKDTVWGMARSVGAPINTPGNEGAQSISSDGRSMYFTACDREDGLGRCDIYHSSLEGTRWTVGTNLGAPVNSRYWESQPSINADGNMLFFVSNRTGGLGGMDIWYSVKKSDGKWGSPINPGASLNTPEDEFSPFIYFNGKTLYFSTNGRKSFGGFDIYSSEMQPDSSWSEPKNLGPGINTPADESGLIISSDGKKAYFSSVRDKSRGKDIFSIDLPENIAPEPVSYFAGVVRDKKSGLPVKATVELINLSTRKDKVNIVTEKDGSFLICLPKGTSYGLNVSSDGYMFYSENFDFKGGYTSKQPYRKNVFLNPIDLGESLRMYNVFYDIDSWELLPESGPELEKLYQFLTRHNDLKVEIAGHTDSSGSLEHNQKLSENRAESVRNYLISRGINAKQLTWKGYGETRPLVPNDNPEAMKLNRRTEVTIISFMK
ncbi:MAG TPA: OmpA family protein [Bacteroidales bacterium]|nr:OmpA family protein [Bacteroidales bacterium]